MSGSGDAAGGYGKPTPLGQEWSEGGRVPSGVTMLAGARSFGSHVDPTNCNVQRVKYVDVG
jgi:hypothetical protein